MRDKTRESTGSQERASTALLAIASQNPPSRAARYARARARPTVCAHPERGAQTTRPRDATVAWEPPERQPRPNHQPAAASCAARAPGWRVACRRLVTTLATGERERGLSSKESLLRRRPVFACAL